MVPWMAMTVLSRHFKAVRRPLAKGLHLALRVPGFKRRSQERGVPLWRVAFLPYVTFTTPRWMGAKTSDRLHVLYQRQPRGRFNRFSLLTWRCWKTVPPPSPTFKPHRNTSSCKWRTSLHYCFATQNSTCLKSGNGASAFYTHLCRPREFILG